MKNDPSCSSDSACRYLGFVCGRGTFVISLAVLVLFLFNMALIASNRWLQMDIIGMQQEITQKNAKLQQDQVFGNIYQSLLQALGTAAVVRKDDQIRNLLSQNNIKVELNPAKAAPAPAAPPAPANP